jgi:hypothetical protein
LERSVDSESEDLVILLVAQNHFGVSSFIPKRAVGSERYISKIPIASKISDS